MNRLACFNSIWISNNEMNTECFQIIFSNWNNSPKLIMVEVGVNFTFIQVDQHTIDLNLWCLSCFNQSSNNKNHKSVKEAKFPVIISLIIPWRERI